MTILAILVIGGLGYAILWALYDCIKDDLWALYDCIKDDLWWRNHPKDDDDGA